MEMIFSEVFDVSDGQCLMARMDGHNTIASISKDVVLGTREEWVAVVVSVSNEADNTTVNETVIVAPLHSLIARVFEKGPERVYVSIGLKKSVRRAILVVSRKLFQQGESFPEITYKYQLFALGNPGMA